MVSKGSFVLIETDPLANGSVSDHTLMQWIFQNQSSWNQNF